MQYVYHISMSKNLNHFDFSILQFSVKKALFYVQAKDIVPMMQSFDPPKKSQKICGIELQSDDTNHAMQLGICQGANIALAVLDHGGLFASYILPRVPLNCDVMRELCRGISVNCCEILLHR